jgi:FdhD protein
MEQIAPPTSNPESRLYPVVRIAPHERMTSERRLPVEAPVAVEYNGIGYAVMMMTPAALKDFAIGFSLSEGLVARGGEIGSIDTHETEQGIVLRIALPAENGAKLLERVRTRVSESSCGLCGLENLASVNRPLPRITAQLEVKDAALFKALESLRAHQPLNAATGGAHAAAFCSPQGEICLVREDVGRHCAIDKLIGALAQAGISPASGFILLSSRCSYELVEKTVLAGCSVLVTISTATTFAASRAKAAGLRLIALARSDAMLEL